MRHIFFVLIVALVNAFVCTTKLGVFLIPRRFLTNNIANVTVVLCCLVSVPVNLSGLMLGVPMLVLSLGFVKGFCAIVAVLDAIDLSLFVSLATFVTS